MSWMGDHIDREQCGDIPAQIMIGIVIGLFVFFGLMVLWIVEIS